MFKFFIKKYINHAGWLFFMSFIFAFLSINSYASVRAAGGVIIFPEYTGDMQHDEIMKSCEYMAAEAFNASGRFIPAEYWRREQVLRKSDGRDRADYFKNAAEMADADIYCVLRLSAVGGEFRLEIKIEPVSDIFSDVKFGTTVAAGLYPDLSLKGGREIARFLEHQKLKSRVTDITGEYAIIDAGQWHGLSEGEYNTSAGRIKIQSISRYSSSAEAVNLKKGDLLVFNLYPDMERFISRINREIDENSARFYGTDAALDKRRGSAKESILGTCFVNTGASFCVPGYGSFLSLEYMGIDKGEPDVLGIIAGGTLTAVHLALPSAINRFDVNFFPWIMDGDKDRETQRLQYFMWGTLPLTFSTVFYNQLAYNYHRKDRLPPLFADHDTTAAIASVFVPGGGMFYKGYRLPGWGFYFAEMSLAGYAVYEWETKEGKYAAGAAAAIKAVEIILSYAVTPSYVNYRKEISSAESSPSFTVGVNNGEKGPDGITASVTVPF